MHTRRNAWIDFQRRAFCPSMFMSSTEYTHLLMILLSFRELKTIPSKKTTLVFTQFIIQTLYAAHQVLSATQNAKSGKPRDKPKLGGINQHKADCYAVCCVSQVVYPARCAKVSCQKNRCVFAPIFLYLLKRRSVLNNRFELF